MEIIVTKDSLKIAEKGQVHKGEYNVNDLHFTFSEEYEGLSKMAVFSNTLNACETAITNGSCIIPAEILMKKMDLTIGVYAYTTENNVVTKRLSPSPITIKVDSGSYIKNLRNPQQENPTAFEQFMEQLEGDIDNLQGQIDTKQDEITEENMLPSDLVDDTDQEHKFVSEAEKTAWNNKSDFSGDYNDLTNKPDLKPVATSGSYNDLSNKPTIPTKVSELQNDSGYQTYEDVQEQIAELGSVFNLKGSVPTEADLPSTGNKVGDVWYVESESAGFVWINDQGTERWEELGLVIDTSDFLTKSGLAQTTGTATNNTMSQNAITQQLNTKQATINNDNKLSADYVATSTSKQFVSDTEKTNWNNKSDFSGSYNDLTDKPDLTVYEEKSNKVDFLDSNVTNTQYTGAKVVYDWLDSIVPTTTATGTTINVQDSSNLPLKDFALLGNATQFTTTGKNLLNASNVLSYTIYTGDQLVMKTGSRNAYLVSVLPSTTYTFSRTAKGGASLTYLAFFDSFDTEQNSQTYTSATNVGDNLTSTFTTSATTNYVMLLTGTGTSTNIMIEKNGSATTYEPYTGGTPAPNPDYPQDIHVVTGDNTVKVVGKNLFEPLPNGSITGSQKLINNVLEIQQTYTSYGRTLTSNNGVLSGNVTEGTGAYYIWKFAFQNLLPNTSYTISANVTATNTSGASNFALIIKYVSFNNGTSTQKCTRTFTTDSNGTYTENFINIDISKFSTFSISDIQLEFGNTDTDYVAYQGIQTQLLSLGNIELAKIGTYQDRIYKSGGKWYLERKIGKVVLDGSESWIYDSSRTRFLATIYSTATMVRGKGLCNYYRYGDSVNSGCFDINVDKRTIYMFTPDSSITTTSAFKTWLSTHNTIVYYVLATPTTTEITDTTLIGQLESMLTKTTYKNTTNMWSVVASGNAEGELVVEYRQDIGTLINNLQTAILSL